MLKAENSQLETCAHEVEVIESIDGVRRFSDDWLALFETDIRGKCLFNDPRYIQLALETDSDKRPLIIVLRQGGRIRCIAPIYTHPGRFLLQASVVTLVSLPLRWAKVFGDAFLIAADEDQQSCYRSVFAVLSGRQAEFDILSLDRVDVDSDLWSFFTKQCAHRDPLCFFIGSLQLDKSHQIVLPATHDEYMSSLSSSTRKNLRRDARRMMNEINTRLVRITEKNQIPGFLCQLDSVYRESWQSSTFAYSARNTELQGRVLAGLASFGWLRSYILCNDTDAIAYQLSYQYDGVFYAQEIAFAKSWARFSPGTVLMHLYIADLANHDPPAVLDFGEGDAAYKRSLCNTHRDVANAYLVPRNRWRWIIRFQRILCAVERVTRRLLIILRLDRIVRKFLKGQG